RYVLAMAALHEAITSRIIVGDDGETFLSSESIDPSLYIIAADGRVHWHGATGDFIYVLENLSEELTGTTTRAEKLRWAEHRFVPPEGRKNGSPMSWNNVIRAMDEGRKMKRSPKSLDEAIKHIEGHLMKYL